MGRSEIKKVFKMFYFVACLLLILFVGYCIHSNFTANHERQYVSRAYHNKTILFIVLSAIIIIAVMPGANKKTYQSVYVNKSTEVLDKISKLKDDWTKALDGMKDLIELLLSDIDRLNAKLIQCKKTIKEPMMIINVKDTNTCINNQE